MPKSLCPPTSAPDAAHPASPKRAAALRSKGTTRTTLALALLLSACASRAPLPASPPAPQVRTLSAEADGPPERGLIEALSAPDVIPRIEPLRLGGPNKPYEALGQRYEPVTTDAPWFEQGLASWYGRKFHGRRTASGEIYDMYAMTAAHPRLPIPSYVRVRNPANGRSVIVRVNDRGPFHPGRIIDLSYAAAARLGTLRGVTPVELERLTHADIRAGWGELAGR